MRIDDSIKILCIKCDITASELSRRLNVTPQALSQKIKRGKFSLDDLQTIATVTGCQLECRFIFANDDKITVV